MQQILPGEITPEAREIAIRRNKIRLFSCIFCGFLITPLFLGLFIWCTVEIGRFQPFYTPIKCTSIYQYLPMHEIVSDTTGVLDFSNKKNEIECQNPNEYDLEWGKSSTDLLMWPRNIGKPGNELEATGTFDMTGGTIESKAGETDTRGARIDLPFSWKLSTKDVQGMEAFFRERIALGDLRPRFPMFFQLNTGMKAKYTFIGSSREVKDVFPSFYCGFQWAYEDIDTTNGTRGFTLPKGALVVDTITICNTDKQKTIADVQELPRGKGPKISVDHNRYINDLNPSPEKLDDMKNSFDVITALVSGVFCILGVIGMASWCMCCYCRYAEEVLLMKKPPPQVEESSGFNFQPPPGVQPPEPVPENLAIEDAPPAHEPPLEYDEV